MSIEERTHYSGRPQTTARWTPTFACIVLRVAAAAVWARPSLVRRAGDVLALASALVCVMYGARALPLLGRAVGNTYGVLVCNRFDYAAARARCTAPDPFVLVSPGAGDAYLQITAPGEAGSAGTPVTINVVETDGAGLVVAEGSTRLTLKALDFKPIVLPLRRVFAAAGVPPVSSAALPAHWERAIFVVQVHAGRTDLGSTTFHLAI